MTLPILKKARRVNCVNSTFPTILDRSTAPPVDPVNNSGRCAIDLTGLTLAKGLAIISFFGKGEDNSNFSCRLYAWYPVDKVSGDTGATGYHCILLSEVLAVLCADVPGIASAIVDETNIYADEIYQVGNSGNPGISSDIVSPGDNVSSAHMTLNLKGASYLEFVFSREGVSEDKATDTNALVACY